MAFVMASGAAAPFAPLNRKLKHYSNAYFTPKSAFRPPGLWLAVRIKPPYAIPFSRVLRFITNNNVYRITDDMAGVDKRPGNHRLNTSVPCSATHTRPTPFPAATLRMV